MRQRSGVSTSFFANKRGKKLLDGCHTFIDVMESADPNLHTFEQYHMLIHAPRTHLYFFALGFDILLNLKHI